jgi:hypothetical protein
MLVAMNERDAKFFRPLWIRVLVTGVVAVWFVLEAVLSHDQLWMGITAVGVIYCVWNFFLRFPKDAPIDAATAIPAPSEEPPKQP